MSYMMGFWGTGGGDVAGPTPTLVGDSGLVELATVNLPVPYPAGIQADDIAFIHAHLHDASNNNTISTPSGWNVVLNHNLDTLTAAHGVFWKRLDGTETGTVTVSASAGTAAGNDTFEAVMSAWRGCVAAGTPYEDMDNAVAGSTNMTGAACTTTGGNRRVVYFGGHSQQATVTPAASWTEVYDYPASNGIADGALHCVMIEQASAGTVSGTSHALSASRWCDVISLALIPA